MAEKKNDGPRVRHAIVPDPKLSNRAGNVAVEVARVWEPFSRVALKAGADAIADVLINPTNTRDWAQINSILGAGLHPDEFRVSYLGSPITMLMLAAYKGNMMAVETILSHGANPTITEAEGLPLKATDYAKMGGHTAIAEKLEAAEKKWNEELNSSRIKLLELIRANKNWASEQA